MRAHLVQTDIAWEDKPANFARVRALLESASIAPRDLIVLPEMFDTGFSANLPVTADSDNLTLRFLQHLARDTRAIIHGSRTTLTPDARGLNQTIVLDSDASILCTYEKTHLFPLGSPAESSCFTPGPGIRTFDWTHTPASSALRVCPTICYDLRFPEVYRVGLDLGAELFTVTSSWPVPREAHRRALSIARAIENQAYVLSVNRCGSDPALSYAGGTLAIDPRGEIIAELAEAPAVLSVDLSPREVRRWRDVFPAWRDRRPVVPAR